jgi:cobalt/nickel transport protein
MIAAPLVAHSRSLFEGTDNRGTATIAKVDPGYKQWFTSIWTPKGSVESFLFAMQAALGAGLVGYVVGSRRQTKRETTTS